jgi:hypothetical protein
MPPPPEPPPPPLRRLRWLPPFGGKGENGVGSGGGGGGASVPGLEVLLLALKRTMFTTSCWTGIECFKVSKFSSTIFFSVDGVGLVGSIGRKKRKCGSEPIAAMRARVGCAATLCTKEASQLFTAHSSSDVSVSL